jgi:hypothetical protein
MASVAYWNRTLSLTLSRFYWDMGSSTNDNLALAEPRLLGGDVLGFAQ